MISLADFCLSRIGVPFTWGETDCACFARDWAVEGLGAADVPFPRPKSAHRAAVMLVNRSMAERARAWAKKAGLVEANDAPRDGDIGIVAADGRQCFAIASGGQWVARSEFGIALIDAPHVLLLRGR